MKTENEIRKEYLGNIYRLKAENDFLKQVLASERRLRMKEHLKRRLELAKYQKTIRSRFHSVFAAILEMYRFNNEEF